MTVERSGRGALITNADYSQYFDFPNTISWIGSQWNIENNNLLSARFFINPPASDSSFIYQRTHQMSFIGTTHNNDELEYGVIVYRYNTNTILTETDYYPSGQTIPIYGEVDRRGYSSPACTYEIYIRRKDGGILTPSDMEQSTITFIQYRNYEVVYTTALPQNWLETTTASFQNPMNTYTTIIPTDYDISSSQYDPLLEIPSKIDTAINFIILGFGRIMNFRYISFVVCFVLIVGLVAWLIH